MRLEVRKYLFDIQHAAMLVTEFTAGKRFSDYADDAMMRAAVERQFEIIGEALAQLTKLDADLAKSFSDHRRIIAFRNILIHGYAEVDARLVWDLLESKLPILRHEVNALLSKE